MDIQEQDCAICLQKYHHPTRLPCGHIFCFLCVKGIALQSKKCAMCRTQIPHDYFDHPDLIEKLPLEQVTPEDNTDVFQWYYEGRNGWWKYDERSNIDLENSYSCGETECLLLLAGTVYCVDFQNMIQIRRSDPTKRRKIKRDIPTLPSKGVAGIKKIDVDNIEASDIVDLHTSDTLEVNEQDNNIGDNSVIIASDNRNMDSPIDDLIESIRSINLIEEPLVPNEEESQNLTDI